LDVFSKKKRSRIMSRIKSSGTKPELALRSALRSCGVTYSCNVRSLPGSPDAVVRRLRLAVFVDGCFWHGCPSHFKLPSDNREFWRKKIDGNARRDRSSRKALRADSWTVWSYWEHETKDRPRFLKNLRRRFRRLESASMTP
jgi:DNA mismatch endonuclease (patch repair protein)